MNALNHILRWNIPLVPEIHHHHYNITAQGSSIMIGNSDCSSYVNCGGDQYTEMEAEMLRLFRSFDMRRKTEAMSCLFKIEDNMKGGENLG